MRTGLTKSQKITEICFDEKEPLIYIRTHNTDLKNRLTAYAAAHPGECRQTDADPDTGSMEFVIRKAIKNLVNQNGVLVVLRLLGIIMCVASSVTIYALVAGKIVLPLIK